MATSKINLSKVKQSVQQKFAEINSALHMREKLLLRQIDVIEQQQLGRGSSTVSKEKAETTEEKEIEFLVEQEEELLVAIRSFGRFQLDNMNLSYLKNEDYITPINDHETMYKCLQTEGFTPNHDEDTGAVEPEAIVVDFSKNKSLIEHNAKNMNESIINITLQEAKELIQKAKVKRETPIPPLNLEELDDELESSIAEAVSSLGRESPVKTKSSQTSTCVESKKATKKNRFKPKITINNCNGTINLSNISSLTINCANEETISAEIPLQRATEQDHAEEDDEDTSTQYLKYKTKNTENVTTTTTTASSSSVSSSVVTNPKGEVPQAPISASVTLETNSTGNSTPTATNTTSSSSNYSSNSSSRSQSKKLKSSKKLQNNKNSLVSSTTVSTNQQATSSSSTGAYPYEIVHNDDADEATPSATCDFYNRLLNEIKNSIKEKSIRTAVPVDNSQYTQAAAADSTCDNNSNASCSTASCSTQPGKRLILKNYENLKIILEANSDDETFHPVQIEQWLAEIISETDLEPMQNTDILEHSKINEQQNA